MTYQKYIKNFFNKRAFVYDFFSGIFDTGSRKKVVEILNPKKHSKILDVCTGTGKQAFEFAKKGCSVIGIDISKEMVKVAKKKNKFRNVKFKVVDASRIPFKSNSFDLSSVSFGLHDAPQDTREKILKEIRRVTKPKGRIVILDYALPKNSFFRFLLYNALKFYDTKYFPEYTRYDLRRALEKEFKIEKEVPMSFGTKMWLGIKK